MNKSAALSIVSVDIPDDGTDLVGYFQSMLNTEFREALDFDVVAQRDRAVLGAVKITGVMANGADVTVDYRFSFSAYLGCRDANWSEDEFGSVYGTYSDGEWIFDRHIPWEPRSTVDEF